MLRRDPFVSGYVRSVDVKLFWKQKHWKKLGGMVTRQPTPDEERALAETLAALPAVDRLSLEWKSQPDPGAPTGLFATVSEALAPRLRTLALHAPMSELRVFVNAVDVALLRNIEWLEVFVVPSHRAHADEATALGKWIAAAGSACLLYLRLTFCHSVNLHQQHSLTPCFVAINRSHFGCLKTLELRFLLRGLNEEGTDALLTFFHHVAPTLENLSLDVLCSTSGDLTQRQQWVERWIAPLVALRWLKLEWAGPQDRSVSSRTRLKWLPQIRSSSPRLSDLIITGLRFTSESVERLLAGIPSSCPTLLHIQLTVDRLGPKTIMLLATSCQSLVDLKLQFYYIRGAETVGEVGADLSWACNQDLQWESALEV